MEFIIEQQAQFSADIQMLKEAQIRTLAQSEASQAQIEALQSHISALTTHVGALAETQIDLRTQTGALAEMQIQTEVRFGRVEDAVVRIVEVVGQVAGAQAKTDERMNAFINVVERYITGPGNGKK
jgi:Asp-tRNA(Asn)/Glu-tRNA(Gln) amidotransferase C subunit